MRDAFVQSMIELAESDEKVFLITGDLGFGIFDEYTKRFPNQFLNVGVAEQNMMGVATGMALEGRRVFAYSIGNFVFMRCLEQIRNDACYHQANITIVASGGGFTYGALGMSHHATEDIAILRALPDVTVVVPGDAWESGEATKQLAYSDGVSYLRIEKNVPDLPRAPGEKFTIGKARRVREGEDLTFVVTGGVTSEILKATDILERQYDFSCRVINMHTIKPIDVDELVLASEQTGGIFVVEEHNIVGGLSGAVSEVLLNIGAYPKVFNRLGINDQYLSIVGEQNYLRKQVGIDARSLIQSVVSSFMLKTKNHELIE